MAYFECMLIFITLVIIYSITKLKVSRIKYVIYGLITIMNMLNIMQILINDVNMFFDIRFFFTIAFSFGCRLSSFFYVDNTSALTYFWWFVTKLLLTFNSFWSEKYVKKKWEKIVHNLPQIYGTFFSDTGSKNL